MFLIGPGDRFGELAKALEFFRNPCFRVRPSLEASIRNATAVPSRTGSPAQATEFGLDVFRLATPDDAAAILEFTEPAEAGLTTVPRTRQRVEDYIGATMRFLDGDRAANRVLFVAERDGEVMGISGIIPKLGVERPFYSFKRSRHAGWSAQLDLRTEYETLQLTTDFDDYTELASIFLAPKARGKGIARLLSLGRLCFIENHRDLFSDRLMADIRGWVGDDGISPFWRHLTSKFITTDFEIADRLSASDGRFIMELMPSLPILMNLLPEPARHCAGRPHDISSGAMNLLISAGFEGTDLCDIFDGGPAIQCRVNSTLIARTVEPLRGFSDDFSAPAQRLVVFSGQGRNFKATIAPGHLANGTVSATVEAIGAKAKMALAQDRRH